MRSILFALFFFTGVLSSYSQITIQPVLPAAGMVQKVQLWNIVVINNSVDQYDCRLTVVLRDRVTNLEVLTGTSDVFSLPAGAKQLNISSLGNVQYNYAIGEDSKLQGLMPVGNYIACYSLITAGDKTVDLADECVPFDVEPLSPPFLITPADSSVLEISPNQFTWVPPSPQWIFNGLNYEIIIVPVYEGQKAQEAIQQNIPVFSQVSLPGNFLNYSPAFGAFEKEKWYAWQVVARDNRNYAGKTETWVFKLSSKSRQDIISQTPFIKLNHTNSGLAVAPSGILKLYYKNERSDSFIKIYVANVSRKDHKETGKSFKIDIQPGENYIQYDLNKVIKIEEGKVYQAQITNSSGENYSVQFIVKFPGDKN